MSDEIPRHFRIALANVQKAFETDDLRTLGTVNEDLQHLVDAAIAWGRRRDLGVSDAVAKLVIAKLEETTAVILQVNDEVKTLGVKVKAMRDERDELAAEVHALRGRQDGAVDGWFVNVGTWSKPVGEGRTLELTLDHGGIVLLLRYAPRTYWSVPGEEHVESAPTLREAMRRASALYVERKDEIDALPPTKEKR